MSYSYIAEYDEHTSLGHTLVKYLKDFEWEQGKKIKAVHPDWAEPEEIIEFPSIVIMPTTWKWDANSFTPRTLPETKEEIGEYSYILFQDAEFVGEFELCIWATDPIMRAKVVKALKEKFFNGDGSYGIKIKTNYYKQIAVFSLIGGRYEDNEIEAKRRHRLAFITIEGRVPSCRVLKTKKIIPRFQITEIGENVKI